MPLHKLRRKLYHILEASNLQDSLLSRLARHFLGGVIVLSLIGMISETVPAWRAEYYHLFRFIEYFTISSFTIEFTSA